MSRMEIRSIEHFEQELAQRDGAMARQAQHLVDTLQAQAAATEAVNHQLLDQYTRLLSRVGSAEKWLTTYGDMERRAYARNAQLREEIQKVVSKDAVRDASDEVKKLAKRVRAALVVPHLDELPETPDGSYH